MENIMQTINGVLVSIPSPVAFILAFLTVYPMFAMMSNKYPKSFKGNAAFLLCYALGGLGSLSWLLQNVFVEI